VFDVRCLPNPYWELSLRRLNGRDEPVKVFLDAAPAVQEMIDDIVEFLHKWIPRYEDSQRSYLTVAVGCTGGMHRSVYVAEANREPPRQLLARDPHAPQRIAVARAFLQSSRVT